jgi:hypothetical protein
MMNPFRCRMWEFHDRLEAHINEKTAPRRSPVLTRLRGFEGWRMANLLIHRGVSPEGLHYTGVAEAA